MLPRLAFLIGGLALAATVALLPTSAHGRAPAPGSPPRPATGVTTLDAGGAPPTAYRLPFDGPVARLFDRPATPWSAGHRGVDLAGDAGAPVRAPAAGTVVFSDVVVDRAVLTVEHPDGRRSTLEPLADAVPAGTEVGAGDVVGTLAAPGADPRGGAPSHVSGGTGHCGTLPCLHWGVRRGEDYLDPLDLLDPAPVVLLPSR